MLFALQVLLLSAFIVATPNPTQFRNEPNEEAVNGSGSGDDGEEQINISHGANFVRFATIFFAAVNSIAWVLSTFSLGSGALNLVRNSFVWADSLAIIFTIIYLIPSHGIDSAVWKKDILTNSCSSAVQLAKREIYLCACAVKRTCDTHKQAPLPLSLPGLHSSSNCNPSTCLEST